MIADCVWKIYFIFVHHSKHIIPSTTLYSYHLHIFEYVVFSFSISCICHLIEHIFSIEKPYTTISLLTQIAFKSNSNKCHVFDCIDCTICFYHFHFSKCFLLYTFLCFPSVWNAPIEMDCKKPRKWFNNDYFNVQRTVKQ